MGKRTWDDAYDTKTVSTKMTKLKYANFKTHCDQKGLTPSAVIKKLIDNEVERPIPANIAGKNSFIYNKNKDNFNWRVILDNGLRIDIEDNLSAEYVSQLLESLKQATDERDTYIKKENGGVAIPSKLVRKGI